MTRARILLADDHKEMRERVARLLEPEFNVVGVVSDGQELLNAIPASQPDVCLVDISMPVVCGIEAASRLQGGESKAKIIFLTVHDDPDFIDAALKTGGSGYVVKSQIASDLRIAIRAALAGELFISRSLNDQPADSSHRFPCS